MLVIPAPTLWGTRYRTSLASRLFYYAAFPGASHCRLSIARRFVLAAARVHRARNRTARLHRLWCLCISLRLCRLLAARGRTRHVAAVASGSRLRSLVLLTAAVVGTAFIIRTSLRRTTAIVHFLSGGGRHRNSAIHADIGVGLHPLRKSGARLCALLSTMQAFVLVLRSSGLSHPGGTSWALGQLSPDLLFVFLVERTARMSGKRFLLGFKRYRPGRRSNMRDDRSTRFHDAGRRHRPRVPAARTDYAVSIRSN